jgi:DNA repair protein RecO (recombination protein O)
MRNPRPPRVYRAEVLVLRRLNFGEADRLLTLLTRDRGKVRALAKGARRPTSRHSGNLEPFAHAQILLARGRDLDIVSQSELLHPFRGLREDLQAASHAYYLAEVTDALLQQADVAARPFTLLLDAFGALDGGAPPTLLGAHFLLQLLETLGYRPELFACLGCRAELQPQPNFLSLSQGGALCPICGPRQADSQTIGVEALKVMRHLQRTERLGSFAVNVSGTLAQQVDRQARAFVEFQVDRRLRSPEFIARLRDLSPSHSGTPAKLHESAQHAH